MKTMHPIGRAFGRWAIHNRFRGLTRDWKDRHYSVFTYYCAPWATRLVAPLYVAPEARSTAPTWNPKGGWLYVTLAEQGTKARRHWVSYRGKHIEWCIGTQPPTGVFHASIWRQT
jgi:hypothetical protein